MDCSATRYLHLKIPEYWRQSHSSWKTTSTRRYPERTLAVSLLATAIQKSQVMKEELENALRVRNHILCQIEYWSTYYSESFEDKITCQLPWTEEKNGSLRDCESANDLLNYINALDTVLYEGEPKYYNYTGCIFPCSYYHYTFKEESPFRVFLFPCFSLTTANGRFNQSCKKSCLVLIRLTHMRKKQPNTETKASSSHSITHRRRWALQKSTTYTRQTVFSATLAECWDSSWARAPSDWQISCWRGWINGKEVAGNQHNMCKTIAKP